jgi:predicted ATPase/DNA-binding winged helix-turn-helix (wHTH) protein
MRYAFSDCVLDTDTVQLVVGGVPVPVQPQVFDVLRVLIEERDRVVPKEELLDRVWGHAFVTESTLTSRIKSARRAIGDDGAAQRLIRTVHRRGYQFVGEVDVGDGRVEERADEPVAAGSAPHPWSSLPVPSTPLVGRTEELDRLEGLLRTTRLVTVVGPGGVGKTRLAVATAERRAPGSTAFVDLTVVRDPELVVPRIAAAVGLRGDSATSRSAVCEYLSGRSALLVVDNLEHVIAAAPDVGALVRSVPDLAVIATSRERLRVEGEHVLQLEPLQVRGTPEGEVGEAVQLFVLRATSIDPSFDVAATRRPVQQICAAIDGLPLAIELVAGQVLTLPPDMLATRLTDRLRSGELSRRDAPPRQRTVTDTIDWSLNLVTGRDRSLFRRMGVFVGDVPLEMVEQVCADDEVPRPLDALARLVECSLVRRRRFRDGSVRFGMLELLRAHAAELLSGSEDRDTRERHAEAVAKTLEDVERRRWGDLAGAWIDRVADLMPEARGAQSWARRTGDWDRAGRLVGALGAYWHREGGQVEARRWVDEVMLHADGLGDRTLSGVLATQGRLAWVRDDQDEARDAWHRAAELFRRVGDERHRAYVTAYLAVTLLADPDRWDEGRGLTERGIGMARSVGDPGLLAEVLTILGEFCRATGDDESAREAYEEAARLSEGLGDVTQLSIALANLNYLHCHVGEYGEAREIGRRALGLCSSQGRRLLSAWSVSELAGPALGLGEHELAARLLGASERAMETLAGARYPPDVGEHERVATELVAALGQGRFAEAYAAGAEMTLDEAIELALGEAGDGQAHR